MNVMAKDATHLTRHQVVQHCAPADRLNRGVFENQFRAVGCTILQMHLLQPAAELHRWAAISNSFHICQRYMRGCCELGITTEKYKCQRYSCATQVCVPWLGVY
jgi:hypothetical protein